MKKKINKEPEVPAITGWKCPVCGRGNSPFNPTCPCIATPAAIQPVEPPSTPTWPYPWTTWCGNPFQGL
ncbi:MAG: hypothetical protein KGL39_33675 [Patescibacteria group bacterium]|nr:hypothetical protein [Patescibacteria group bacterium]